MLARTSRTCQWLMSRRIGFNYTAFTGTTRQANDWDTPPKYVYELQYLPIINPLMYGGYHSHSHGGNPFIDEAESHFEIFEFEYPGQWWHLGSSFITFLGVMFPFLLAARLMYKNSQGRDRGMPILYRAPATCGDRIGEVAEIEY